MELDIKVMEDSCKGTKGKLKTDVLAIDTFIIFSMEVLGRGVVDVNVCKEMVGEGVSKMLGNVLRWFEKKGGNIMTKICS